MITQTHVNGLFSKVFRLNLKLGDSANCYLDFEFSCLCLMRENEKRGVENEKI